MKKNSKIYVAGHNGLVGLAIIKNLHSRGYFNLITRAHKELDLTRQNEVEEFFKKEQPEFVFLAAAKVGGIQANNLAPADFFYLNSMIQNNVIHSAYRTKVKKLLFLGSTCVYPKDCEQPLKEKHLLSNYLEPTNEAYAIAKIAGLKMCQYYKKQHGVNFVSCMPTNLYGPNDNFDLETSHVLPALIKKFHDAKVENSEEVKIWGTGMPLREFLYVDDMADASVFLMENYNDMEHINIGTGEEISIKDLAELIKRIVGFSGKLAFDSSKPDGIMRKVADVSKLNALGWRKKTTLTEGIKETYRWYIENFFCH